MNLDFFMKYLTWIVLFAIALAGLYLLLNRLGISI